MKIVQILLKSIACQYLSTGRLEKYLKALYLQTCILSNTVDW